MFDWLKAKHHFEVWPDGNPANIGPLVVWNDDEIAPGTGFGLHGKPKTVPRSSSSQPSDRASHATPALTSLRRSLAHCFVHVAHRTKPEKGNECRP